ncbi:MAG TPA: Sec-independent protein translocase protein TatB [Deltaproteobacteria bacterium]|nr:Sec-independent protein translocase protein TatB [Deltaproteobacteria bacterium]HPP81743.1 Sec-independent protein translocase protein TatB [Deltaproteobacteria bacterium]
MFGIGGQELLVILVIALIVLGPKNLPEIARTLGRAFGQFQRATDDIKREFESSLTERPSPEAKKDDERRPERDDPQKAAE